MENAAKHNITKPRIVSFLALFASGSTLLCCALPAAVAAIAGGAAIGSLVSTFPFIITLSKHKIWLFAVAFLLIIFSGILAYRPKGAIACSITGGRGCEVAGRFTKSVIWISAIIYLAGLFFAYGLVPVLRLLGV